MASVSPAAFSHARTISTRRNRMNAPSAARIIAITHDPPSRHEAFRFAIRKINPRAISHAAPTGKRRDGGIGTMGGIGGMGGVGVPAGPRHGSYVVVYGACVHAVEPELAGPA